VTKLNKKKLYYEAKINDIKNDGKTEYFKINYGQKDKFYSDGLFITKPFDDYFIGKVGKFRQEMPIMNSEPSYSCKK
jgi:hypothetical protein